jgi:hypothetical protein
MLKGNKGGGDFTSKTNQFFLDVGWIRLTKMLDFNEMLNDFKNTDLLVYNIDALKKHFTRTEFNFDLETIINQYKMEHDVKDLNIEKKIIESKKVVA